MKGPVKKISKDLSEFVRASSSIGTFHTAVEEVILNSIDAESLSIDVKLDFENFIIEVCDDGNICYLTSPHFVLLRIK